MQFLNVASEAWFSTRAKHPCRNIHASKIKSPHESSTKTKWAQMAFKESHLAYETLGTWKTSELFYFVMSFLGSESSASKCWPESSAKNQPNSNQRIRWFLTQTSALETSQRPSKGKKQRIWGVVEQSIFSSIFAIPPKQSEYKIYNLKPLKGANCYSLTRNMIFLALEVSPGVRQDPSPTGL